MDRASSVSANRLKTARRLSLLSATFLAASATAAIAATDFDAYLQRGYSEVAAYAWSRTDDPAVALHFEQKAEMVDAGRTVAPDEPLAGNRELLNAHRQLLRALAAGAAEDEPRMTAVAQVNYDCWAANLGGAASGSDAAGCRLLFYTAMNQIEASEDGITSFVTNAGPDSPSDPRDDDRTDRPSLVGENPVSQNPGTDAPPVPPAAPPAAAFFVPPASPTTEEPDGPDAANAGDQASGDGTGSGTDGDAGDPDGAGTDDGGAIGALGEAVGDTVSDVTGALGNAVSDVGRGVGGAVGALGDKLGGSR